MPTLKQMEALRWIAVLGSFEKAAERLHTSQSAISKRIQELEAVLGTPVFDRNKRGARLTVKGDEIVAICEEMLALRDRLVAVGSNRVALVRELRFGVTELTAITWLPAFVSELRANHPDIVLEPDVGMSVDLFQALNDGEVDFIVVPDAFWRPGFRRVPLMNVQNAWMCSPDLFLDRGVMRLEDLARYNILTQGGRSGSGLVFGKWLEERGIDFPRMITSNSLIALVGLTVAAVGVSYLPQRCFEGLVDQGKLRVIETDPPLPPVTYVAMFRAEVSNDLINSVSAIARATCNFADMVRFA